VFSKNNTPEKRTVYFLEPFGPLCQLHFLFTLHAYGALTFLMDKTKLNLNLGMSLWVFLCYLFLFVLMKNQNLRAMKVSLMLTFIVIGYTILFVVFTKIRSNVFIFLSTGFKLFHLPGTGYRFARGKFIRVGNDYCNSGWILDELFQVSSRIVWRF